MFQVCWAKQDKSKNEEFVFPNSTQKQNLSGQVMMPRAKTLLELFQDGSKIVQMVPELLEFIPSPPQ